MDILVANLTKANEAYRNGQPITMTDDEYDAGIELLASKVPNHPLLKQIRAPPSANGAVVRMPFYLGSLDKAKVSEDLEKWVRKSPAGSTFMVSEKLDGISGLWNPGNNKLYLSGDDNMGVDVSSWLRYISLSPKGLESDIPNDIWIRGELIMPKDKIPAGRLGRSIINGIFHHKEPNPVEAAKVRFIGYEIIGMDAKLTVQQQFAWLQTWGIWIPWSVYMKELSTPDTFTKLLGIRRNESAYDMDGLVIKLNKPIVPRVLKGNPKDALAWKPPNGESKLTKVVRVEWNASSTGKLIPRVEIEPVHIGGSTITFVTGVNARRVVEWQIGPGATVVIRKGGDVIPLIDTVEIPAAVVFPADDTWEWDGDPLTASNIKQKVADASTIAAQYIKMIGRLGWENIGPSQVKAVIEAGYVTVPLLRKASEDALKKLLGPVKGAHLYKTIQKDGWVNANEIDLFVASPLCPSGIGKTRLEALLVSESDVTKWSRNDLVVPKGWSMDVLKDFQEVWKKYESFRKDEWSFLPYPVAKTNQTAPATNASTAILKGTVVFSGFRDTHLESQLAERGYKVIDTVKADTKAVLIAVSEDPATYTSTKIEKAKKIPGCVILRRSDWKNLA